MLNRPVLTGLALAATLALQACASIPRSTTPEAKFVELNCADLESELTKARESQRVAAEARSTAWYAVLPLLVTARFAHAHSALSEAEDRSAKLQDEQKRKSCAAADAQP